MSKPSLRLQFTKLLVFYHVLLWQLGQWPQFKFHCRADGARLPLDEVYALRDFMNNTELRPEQIIEETYCSDVVWSYGFVIECNCTNESECRITGIRMSYLGLTGTIHKSVGDLTSLTYLILSNNTLHGGIPDTIGNLKNLEVLDLSRNQLNGSIPESLGGVVSLRWLYLQYNLLSQGIPPSFGSLTKLTELNLQFNMLSDSIPEDFGNLSSLTIMDLSENQLNGPLPESLRNLKSLKTFYVSANYLSGEFPKGYDNLACLKKFSIAGNYISGPLPVETIAKWTKINSLVLVGNNFEGNLTTEIFGLQYLQYLLISDLANDGFQLPPNISNSANFISLTLRNCSITGPIPKYIGEMTSLRYLDLSFNKLTGGLPQKMSSKMIDMSFSGNMLDGTIPPWIQLNETIPPRKRGFQTRIDLSFNNFSAIGSPVPSNQQLNWFACCRNSSTNQPVMMENRYCPENNPKYHSLFINCGGEETTVHGNKYDQDNDTSLFYTSPEENWAYSLSGGYEAPVSLKYYAFCLHKGNYTVTLYFNEVVYTKNEDYISLSKLVFDVYIQDVRRLNYVNIREKKGSEPITANISAVVVNDSGLLNIHFYWPGKGSDQYQPSFNGPLISAISVTPELNNSPFPLISELNNSPEKNNGQRVALITLASIVAALPLSMAFAWRMGWLPSPESPKTDLDKKVDEHQDSEEQPSPEPKGDHHHDSEELAKTETSQDKKSDEHQDSEEFPSQEERGDEHQDSEELLSQEEIGDEQRNTKGQEEIGDEKRNTKDQEEIGDEKRNTKDQGKRKKTETKRKKKEKIGDERPYTVKKLGTLGLSYGFTLGMSSEEIPSQEEIGDEHQDSEEPLSHEEIGHEHQDSKELPSQEEVGDEQRNMKGQEEIGDEQRNTKDLGMQKNTETKSKKRGKIGDEHPDTVKKLGMIGLSYGFSLGMSSEELPSQEEIGDEHQDSEELPSQEEIGDEHQDSEELPSQEEIGDEQRNTKGQEEIGDEQRNTKDQGRRKNTETKKKKKEKIGDENPDIVKKLGMFGLSYGFPLDMSSEELPSQEEIGDEHQDSKELPSQEEIGDEHQDSEELPSQEEIGDEQRNTMDEGRRKNTETKRKKKEKIGDEHPNTFKKLGMFGLSYGFPLGMSSEELPSQEEIGDEHHYSKELPSLEEIGDEHQDSKELPSQEEIGDEQRNTKDDGSWKNIETKRKKKEKMGDEHPNNVKKLGIFGLSYGFSLGMSSEELPSQEEIGDEHQDSKELPSQEEIGDEHQGSEELPSQEEIGDEQRNTMDEGRRKNTETKRKKKEKIGDEHPDTFKKLGMFGLSYGFPLGMSSEELPSQDEIGDEHQDNKELPSQEEKSDEQRNTKGQEEIGDERNTKDQGRRKNIETRRKKKEKIGDEHLDTVKELINATENFSDKKRLGHSETFFMAQLPSHTVAVKKLDSAHFKGKIDKLKEEIGIIESLQHNNILKLLHAYIGKDLQFLVYEYMENKSLEDILFGSSTSGTIKLDWNTRVNICLGIAQGLQYLHERVQIVHTNIKSANILLNEKLEAKISDFGFANLYSEEDKVMAIARETKKGYTAPEYLQMDDLDSKLDVFSFGVVVLEIVSGERNVRNQSKKETEVLLDRAYKANRNGNLKSLVDKNLSTYDEREALIILKLALECTTMGASVRPEMSGVVSVLLGEKSIDEVCSPAKPTGDINVVGSLEELAGISDTAAKPTGDINVVGSLEESAGISDMAESLSPLWGS
ncbi:unnamed protein product [Malus baccata var. baccata]